MPGICINKLTRRERHDRKPHRNEHHLRIIFAKAGIYIFKYGCGSAGAVIAHHPSLYQDK